MVTTWQLTLLIMMYYRPTVLLLLSFHTIRVALFALISSSTASAAPRIIVTPNLSRIHVVRLKKNAHSTSTAAPPPLAFKSSSWVRRSTNAASSASESKSTRGIFYNDTKDTPKLLPLDRIKQSIGNLLFKRLVDSVYDDADTNKDGKISLAEVNTLVLQMYVKINRAAPIPPPSRDKVDALFASADVDGNKRLSREEFSRLAVLLASRATTRLVAHKVVSFVVAPVLAIKTVEGLSGRHLGDGEMTKRLVPARMQRRIADANLWKTLLTVVFVKGLGNVVISSVTVVLDAMHLASKDENK